MRLASEPLTGTRRQLHGFTLWQLDFPVSKKTGALKLWVVGSPREVLAARCHRRDARLLSSVRGFRMGIGANLAVVGYERALPLGNARGEPSRLWGPWLPFSAVDGTDDRRSLVALLAGNWGFRGLYDLFHFRSGNLDALEFWEPVLGLSQRFWQCRLGDSRGGSRFRSGAGLGRLKRPR